MSTASSVAWLATAAIASTVAVEKPQKMQAAASFSGEVAGPWGQIAAAGDGDVVLTDNDEYGPATGDIYGATLAAGAVEVQGPAASGEAYAAMVTQQPAADGNREHSAVQVGRDGHFGRPIGLDAVPISDASAFLDPTGVVADRNGRYIVAWRHSALRSWQRPVCDGPERRRFPLRTGDPPLGCGREP